MSLTARIARNTIIQITGKGVALLFGMVSIGLLTRYLGQSGFGAYTTVVSFVQFFGTLADLGLYIVTVKKISEATADVEYIFRNVVTLRIVSALVFVVAGPLVVLFFPYPTEVKIGVAVVSVTNLFVQLGLVYTSIFQRALAMFRVALAEIIGKAVILGLTAVLVATHQSFTWVLVAMVVGSGVQCLATIIFAQRFVRVRLAFDFAFWRTMLRDSWPVALSIALNLIYFRADTIILSLFQPQEVVGIYGASYKVLEVLVAFPAMFVGLVTPLIALHASKQDWGKFSEVLQKGFDFLATLAIPVVVGTFVVAHPLMTFVAGEAFTQSGTVLRVLVIAVASIFFGTMFGNSVVALGKQRSMMKYYLGVAIFALAGYFVFIPIYGMWGAAVMTVATEMAIMFSSYHVIRKASAFRVGLGQTLRALFAALCMAAALYLARGLSLALLVPLGMVVYGGVLALCGGVQRQLIRELMQRP